MLEGQAQYMIALHKAVQSAIARGKKVDDLVKTENGRQVAQIQLPDSVKNWVGPSLGAQVKDAFNEITTGKASGDLPHQ